MHAAVSVGTGIYNLGIRLGYCLNVIHLSKVICYRQYVGKNTKILVKVHN